MKKDVNVGFLVSYDYELLKIAIPLIYEDSDRIILALDRNLKTWSGNSFEVKEDFFSWIKEIDIASKITIYRDDFYVPELSAMECETRERKMLASQMSDGWIIQLDADEFFVDFKDFIQKLQKYNYLLDEGKKVQIAAFWIPLFKKLESGFLYFNEPDKFYLGTTSNVYKKARNCKLQTIFIPSLVIHYTWSRSEEELYFKLKNWGHNIDFDLEKYMDLWRSITEKNYKNFSNLHPFSNKEWKQLEYVEGGDITEIINNFKDKNKEVSKRLINRKNLKQKIKYFF